MKAGFLTIGAILTVALCTGGPSFAQENPEDCGALCVCVTDALCSGTVGCDADGPDCESMEFTVNCAAGSDYKLEVVLSCPENCATCFACGVIATTSGTWVAGVQTGCDDACGQSTIVHLTGGSYKLRACLRRCPGSTCTTSTGCTVKARVSGMTTNCSAPCER